MLPQYFATGNLNKFREVREIIGSNIEHLDIELPEVQALDVLDVVKAKAESAFKSTGKVVLVEDTGLYFNAWKGLPGALIKWFLSSIGAEGILKMLSAETDRSAVAKTAVGFFDGKNYFFASGEITGKISERLQGGKGFGWDMIFIPDGFDQTFAEMGSEQKNKISMRRKALLALAEKLKEE